LLPVAEGDGHPWINTPDSSTITRLSMEIPRVGRRHSQHSGLAKMAGIPGPGIAITVVLRCGENSGFVRLKLGALASSVIVILTVIACLCGSLAQCALSLKRLSAGPGFNPQTRQNKLFHDYWRACFEINFSDRQEGLTVSSIICDR